ncbi:MAG: hypothetical protein R3314_00050 [Longimicrobiales bacterium]|nr:hypothetical protein [Longimicrobiales bacterium]
MAFRRRCVEALLLLSFAGLGASLADGQELEVHMWTGGQNLMEGDPELFRTMLTFAKRHDIVPYQSGNRDTLGLRNFFEWTTELGIEEVWLEIGPGREATAREFVEDPEKRAPALARFRAIARIFNEYYPDGGRISLFDEAPLGGFGRDLVDGHRDYFLDFDQFRRHAPEAFAMMSRALKEEMPTVEVGVFLHHPHNASEAMAGEYSLIDEFMRRATEHGATPDFIYSDIYRGWLARGFGIEGINDYITDVVRNIRTVADRYGVGAYQLGQIHTIRLGHTPSRWEIDTNVDAMMAGEPDGLGWYWPNYSATNHMLISRDPGVSEDRLYDVSFDPFVPNSQGAIGPAGSVIGTSRDRFTYGYLRLLEAGGAIEPRERFDLWIYGHDFDHSEHRVSLRTADGDWEFLGSINPQQDREGYVEDADTAHMYSYADRSHAVLFHALERDRFLVDGRLQVRFETPNGRDGSTVSAVYAMPYRETRNFLTEAEVTRFIEVHPRWADINSLAAWVRPRPLAIDAAAPVTITVQARRPVGPDAARAAWREALGLTGGPDR